MKRRQFCTAILTAGSLPLFSESCSESPPEKDSVSLPERFLPEKLGGKTIEKLYEDYLYRLFDRYLPFWDNDALDESGAVFCDLNDGGSIAEDKIFIWYQARALRVYSFLYNNFGQNSRYLEIAHRVRNFLVNKMYADEGNGTNGFVVTGV